MTRSHYQPTVTGPPELEDLLKEETTPAAASLTVTSKRYTCTYVTARLMGAEDL